MPPIRTARLPRIALALTFAALAAHAVATRGAEAARYEMRDQAVEQAPGVAGPSRYDVRASLRAEEPAAPRPGRYRAKAALGGDSVAAVCGASNDLFANSFETP